jgi:hypothetical protein
MIASAADQAEAAAWQAGAGVLGIPKINPKTRLSTDYLNQFNEAMMVLDILSNSSDCLEDFLAWRPRSYAEHFAGSGFTDRHVVVDAYEAADPNLRRTLDQISDRMNALLTRTRDAMRADPDAARQQALARQAAAGLKPLIYQAAALINGTPAEPSSSKGGPQSAIDALFSR